MTRYLVAELWLSLGEALVRSGRSLWRGTRWIGRSAWGQVRLAGRSLARSMVAFVEGFDAHVWRPVIGWPAAVRASLLWMPTVLDLWVIERELGRQHPDWKRCTNCGLLTPPEYYALHYIGHPEGICQVCLASMPPSTRVMRSMYETLANLNRQIALAFPWLPYQDPEDPQSSK